MTYFVGRIRRWRCVGLGERKEAGSLGYRIKLWPKGELNPADIPTRISSNLLECFAGCWFTGPPGLCTLPVCGNEISCGGKVDEEVVVACSSEVVLNNATRKDTTDETCLLSHILDCTR